MKICPHCIKGQLFKDKDEYLNECEYCLQCGYIKYLQEPKTLPWVDPHRFIRKDGMPSRNYGSRLLNARG